MRHIDQRRHPALIGTLLAVLSGCLAAAPARAQARLKTVPSPSATMPLVPLSVFPASMPLGVALPALLGARVPVSVAAAPQTPRASKPVSAAASLAIAATPVEADASSVDAGIHFDGSRPLDNHDGSDSRALVVSVAPSEAPVLSLTQIYFPGTYAVGFTPRNDAHVAMIKKAMGNGGYLVATSVGPNSQGHNNAAVLVKLENVRVPVVAGQSVLLTFLRAATITGYLTIDGVSVAKVSYPAPGPSHPIELERLKSLALELLDRLAANDLAIGESLIQDVRRADSIERLTNLLAQELPIPDRAKIELLNEPSLEARLRGTIFEMKALLSPAPPTEPASQTVDSFSSPEALAGAMTRLGMPEAIQNVLRGEYAKYAQLNPKESEAQKLRAYMEWLLAVPWSRRTEDNFDIAQARSILDADHFGLERVKERVLEFLALRKKTGSKKGAIIAFTGPPGVGKTSIASAIAQALGRRFVRLSLGGVHDETVLRGHGRTYLGSMPGMIMRLMKNAGTVNPVLLLDEVDKIGREGNAGDPTAALLEILDPAQNNTFRDQYLDVPYDLSEVLFIVTANELGKIPEPLRDRMELIEFDGYTTLEKTQIAQKHIIPEKIKEMGLTPEEASLTPAAIRRIIEGYTREAGVRALRSKIGAVMRKIAAWVSMRAEKTPGRVDENQIEKYLGIEQFSPRQTAQNGVGVGTGLAVDSFGGSTLNVEVSMEPGTGRLTLRKQFGDEIEDSARNALKYVKHNAARLGLKNVDFHAIDIDINITPAGKVDGPSAGALMVTTILSAITGRSVAAGLVMTGEITMRGDILPIGGLKQKVMAAHRMGYSEVIFPFANLKDIENIPSEVREGIKLRAVKTYDEIFSVALAPAA
ncbi:MAG: endopeptidase La [Elusimicrobiota bacterium]